MTLVHNELTAILRAEIEAAGPISCARFMELALYHPAYGYYHRASRQIGRQGDFYTSVSVGRLFGELLAFQFAAWLEALPTRAHDQTLAPEQPAHGSSSFQLVEAGAHDGRLALDILSWFERYRPELLARLEYWILEPSPLRRRSQADTLHAFAPRIRWIEQARNLPGGGVQGVIFANELLDAFPVLRVGWDAHERIWFEWRVAWEANQFVWHRASAANSPALQAELSNPAWQWPAAELLAVLPDGYTIEICPAAPAWWSQAAAGLAQGKLLTLDYGLEMDELYAPHRLSGTLRSYRGHRLTPDPLARPGEQDITAHVNYSVLRQAGEEAGLKTDCLCPQGTFLTRIAREVIANSARFGSWTPAQSRQFHTLTHPEHLGRSFRVLLQSRAMDS